MFNTNVNALKCNGYFSAVWCSCAQITAMHTELWIKWASDVGQWFQTLVEITSQGTPAKLKVTDYLRFPSMAVSLKIYDVTVVSECVLKATRPSSVFVWKASHCSTAIYCCILYASGLVSWHKIRLVNVFLHSDQPTTTALAFHLYSHLLCARLGNMLYK